MYCVRISGSTNKFVIVVRKWRSPPIMTESCKYHIFHIWSRVFVKLKGIMPRRYSYKMTWAVLHNVNINYIPGNNSLTQNQSRNPLHYSMLSWTNSIGSCTLLWKKIKNSSFLWVTVMPGFFYVFAAFNPDLRYHLSKSFLLIDWYILMKAKTVS